MKAGSFGKWPRQALFCKCICRGLKLPDSFYGSVVNINNEKNIASKIISKMRGVKKSK